jgi:glycosyltransferase involved in cell wall biosynthesis
VRVAFLSPLPPSPTGIADYTADVIEALGDRFAIEAFHAQDAVDEARLAVPVHPAASFAERHRAHPFDVAVYQMGNGPAHAFLYDLLPRVPGLLVLHDLVLHHARARAFLDSPAVRAYASAPHDPALQGAAREPLEAYGAELGYSYPAQAERLHAAQLGTVGDLLPYAYPLFRLPVEASRAVAVHNAFMADAVRAEVPGALVSEVAMPIAVEDAAPERVRALRARLGLAEDALVVGAYGLLTREKRVETTLRAVARVRAALPQVRVLLVGPVPDRAALDAAIDARGLRGVAVVAGRVPMGELPVHVAAADVVVHLRYPTARETSAALLRVLAQGRPTIVSDLENLAELPEAAVVRADVADEEGEVTRALLRLAESPGLRARLGAAARAHVASAHSFARCRETYADAIERAARAPLPPARRWPAHWPALPPA